MHRGRNTLILLLVGLAIGAYVYFVEMKRTPATEASAARPKVFGTGLEAAKIEELRLKASSGERTALKKTGTTWQIVEPVQSPVDETEVTGITSNLATLEAGRTIEENAKDLSKYGLAEPRVEVAFKASGDKDYRRLFVGTKTPTGGDLYAKLATDQKVILIPAYLESTLDRTTFELRDKSILKFDREKVDSVEVATGPSAMTFVKQGDAWTMTKPYRAKTDSTAVEGLIGRLASGQMKNLTAQEPKDVTEYGLAKPEVRVTLGAGSARMGLEIGKAVGAAAAGASAKGAKPGDAKAGAASAGASGAAKGAAGAEATGAGAAGAPGTPGASGEPGAADGVYAKDASRSMVFTIDKALADDLKKTPADYRKKDIFEFREFTGTKMEVSRVGAAVTFENKKEPAKPAGKDAAGKPTPAVEATEKWAQTQPAKQVDASKIEEIATKVANLRADSFVDALPAGAAELMSITTQFDAGKKSEKVVVYKAGADYYAVRQDDAGAAKLPTMGVDDIVKALDAVK